MMKAVATALVLIAGAAVVLWYGNTLNSWVLGGLIGGLAALLLSIPISLTIFSYLSRRHSEQSHTGQAYIEEEELEAFDQPEPSMRMVRGVYEAADYMLPARAEWQHEEEEEELYYQQRQERNPRNLPVPAQQRLPSVQRGYPSTRFPASARGVYGAPARRQSKSLSAERKDANGKRPTSRRMNYPGFPGYEPTSFLSQHRSQALRAARKEAARNYEDIEEIPTRLSRRPNQYDYHQELEMRSERQQPPRTPPQKKSKRVVDSVPSRDGMPRSIPARGETSLHRGTYQNYQYDPETEYLEEETDYHQQTGSMRSGMYTGPMARQPHIEEEYPGTDQRNYPTGSLKKPLVRRAPYMYEDDPLRQELSQQLDTPIIRRSSRHEYDDDDE